MQFITSKEEQTKRLSLCTSCDKYDVGLIANTCTECGCVMSVKVKLAFVKCPINKWNYASPIEDDSDVVE